MVAATALGGCGEQSFGAEEFVERANAEGARLELGAPLPTNQPGKQLYEVELAKATSAAPGGGAHAHDAGSLAVYDGSSGADQGVDECEAAADLLCYRAGNVVIVLEGDPAAAAPVRLGAALEKMAD